MDYGYLLESLPVIDGTTEEVRRRYGRRMLTNEWHGLDIAIEAVVSQSREEAQRSGLPRQCSRHRLI